MFGLTLQQALERLVAMMLITGLNGFIVALLARMLGDRGPSYDGKLSVNPFKHLDLLSVISSILFEIGWIQTLAINVYALRGKSVGAVALVLGSLAAMLLLAALFALARVPVLNVITDPTMASIAANTLRTMVEMTVWFVLFNLIPVPPLTGGLVLRAIAPAWAQWLDGYLLFVRLGLIAVLVSGVPQTVLAPPYDAILWLVR